MTASEPSPLFSLLVLSCALGCGLMAGTFFAFSTFVMKALRRLPPAQGIAAMQSINVVVLNPWFLGVLVSTAAASLGVIVTEFFMPVLPRPHLASIGAAFYVVGTFGVTAVGNVPLNDVLAKLDATNPDAAAKWSTYHAKWTAWNHVRTIAAVIACALLMWSIAGHG
jgi:uncharacterized membrane protein